MNIKSNPISGKIRVAIYARVSSTKQSDEGTIESQVSVLVEYANKQGFEIPEGWVFQDNGISGSIIQRPALDSLRDLIASGCPDKVLIYHPDRLARKYVYQAILLEEFTKYGVEIVFINNKKAETPEEHLLEQFQGVFAEYERAQITERCRRGRLHKAKQGSVTVLPNAPYGYRYIRNKDSGLAYYELHKEESETVLKLFQMYCEGEKLKQLCAYMDQSGKKTRKSIFGWDPGTIRRILKNRTYTGSAGFYKTEKCEGDSQRIVRAPKSGRMQISRFARKDCLEENWLSIPVPAIITEDLYRRVQEKFKESKQFSLRNTKKPSILQGIVVCGKCGSSYYKKARKNCYTYYCCHLNLKKENRSCDNRSIRQDNLDEHVWNWVISLLRNPELVEIEINRRATEHLNNKGITEKKMTLQREQNKLICSRNKLLDAYTEGECLSLTEFKKRMQILNLQTEQVEKELAVIEAQTINEDRIKQTLLTLEKFAKSLENSSATLSVEEKQKVVRALINEIVIHEDSINIRHCIPMGNDSEKGTGKCPLKLLRSATAFAV
jgi:site-specific DNA recombinase